MRNFADTVSQHFPPDVRARLVEAARVPVTEADPMARVRAVDRAVAWARLRYPEMFR